MDGVDYIRESVEAQWAQTWCPKSPEEIRLETLEERHLMMMTQVNALTKALFEANGEYWSVGQYTMGDNLGGIGQRINSKISSSSEQTLQNLRNEIVGMEGTLQRYGNAMDRITKQLKPLQERYELEQEMTNEDWGKF